MKKVHLSFYTLVILLMVFSVSCDSDNGIEINNIEFNNTITSNITFTTAKIESEITPNNQEIISKGICWNTSPNVSIDHNKTEENSNNFISQLTNLVANTTYYYKTYAKTNTNTFYSEENTFSTLSLDNTNWILNTYYPSNSPFVADGHTISSNLNLYDDGTTKFDEIGQGAGSFITYGTWFLDGNNFTYIWEGNDTDINNATYIYTGTITGMEMTGTYIHPVLTESSWNAQIQ